MRYLISLTFILGLLTEVHGARSATQQAPAAGATRESALPDFETWLGELRAEALQRGFSEHLVDRALSDVQQLEVVLQRDAAQVERTLSVDAYLKRRLTPDTIRVARTQLKFHENLLTAVQRQYGVPRSILVAVWGLESSFGKFRGVRPTISALATLAYNPRRAAYFRSELFSALEIAARGDIPLEKMRGSWAGAMGQPQFMPSSYLAHAQDFDGDGRRDIWNSQADVFASIANYLSANGWVRDFTWGREVRVSRAASHRIAAAAPLRDQGCEARRQMSEALPLRKWRSLGVTLANGRPLPSATVDASLLRTGTRTYLVYPNYEALLAYNCAHTYAMSVALLSERMSAPEPRARPRRRSVRRR